MIANNSSGRIPLRLFGKSGDKTEPPQGTIDFGYVAGERWPAAHANYFLNAFTTNEIATATESQIIVAEINSVLTENGLVPTATLTNQLAEAIRRKIKREAIFQTNQSGGFSVEYQKNTSSISITLIANSQSATGNQGGDPSIIYFSAKNQATGAATVFSMPTGVNISIADSATLGADIASSIYNFYVFLYAVRPVTGTPFLAVSASAIFETETTENITITQLDSSSNSISDIYAGASFTGDADIVLLAKLALAKTEADKWPSTAIIEFLPDISNADKFKVFVEPSNTFNGGDFEQIIQRIPSGDYYFAGQGYTNGPPLHSIGGYGGDGLPSTDLFPERLTIRGFYVEKRGNIVTANPDIPDTFNVDVDMGRLARGNIIATRNLKHDFNKDGMLGFYGGWKISNDIITTRDVNISLDGNNQQSFDLLDQNLFFYNNAKVFSYPPPHLHQTAIFNFRATLNDDRPSGALYAFYFGASFFGEFKYDIQSLHPRGSVVDYFAPGPYDQPFIKNLNVFRLNIQGGTTNQIVFTGTIKIVIR